MVEESEEGIVTLKLLRNSKDIQSILLEIILEIKERFVNCLQSDKLLRDLDRREFNYEEDIGM